ncbi:MAG: protein kinase [Pirellulaceae bacterium]|jgi:serine/threonine protein kinase|nr:protein kinase [Pirellulaceae bacterium]MDP7018910.1 protein kinase [Pirellulaceae bacterium]
MQSDWSIPGYEVVKPLGDGGMGHVVLARQTSLDRDVAVKILDKIDCADSVARFQREAKLLAHAGCHNVVQVIDCGVCDERPYLVMEYVDGGTLRNQLSPGQPLPPARVAAMVDDIAAALAGLHERQILHRDLKPENVLIGSDGEIKVSDFGLAVNLDDVGRLTSSEDFVGTVDYVSPEQRYRLHIDERSDQYSLAVIAYEMLTGQKPFGQFEQPTAIVPSLPPSVDEVLQRGLQRDPDDRYSTVADFNRAFQLSLNTDAASTGRSSVKYRLAVAVACLSIAALAISMLRPDPSRATNQANEATSFFVDPLAHGQLDQIGALSFRVVGSEVQVLVVRNRRDTHWTVPKANYSSDMSISATALGEAFEESGVNGVARGKPLGTYSYFRNQRDRAVLLIPVEVTDELNEWPESFRRRRWCSTVDAVELIACDSLRDLVAEFPKFHRDVIAARPRTQSKIR